MKTLSKLQMGGLFAGLMILLGILLWLSPAEKTLGNTVKLVYLHGALVRTAILLMAVSLLFNLPALFSRRSAWHQWGQAIIWAAVGIWLVHTLVSMITTHAAWGVYIAWYEPRTRFTFAAAGVGILVLAVAHLVDSPKFSAAAFTVLAVLVMGLVPLLGLVQHPLNPIGTSTSQAIKGYYAAILVTCALLGGLLSVWMRNFLFSRPPHQAG